jgi:hypothetical protein
MYARQLHTSQYPDAELLRLLRAERTKVTVQHTIRAITTTVTVGLVAWCGSGIADADNNHEQEACALMNDYATATHLGVRGLDCAVCVCGAFHRDAASGCGARPAGCHS